MTLATGIMAQNDKSDVVKLVEPQRNGGMPLMQALNERVTLREFSDKMLSDQQLSDLLWAANGVNRDNGKRTAPSARNCQEIDIYVLMSIFPSSGAGESAAPFLPYTPRRRWRRTPPRGTPWR